MMQVSAEEYARLQARIAELEELVEELQARDEILTALESVGVDNWKGYSIAMCFLETGDVEGCV